MLPHFCSTVITHHTDVGAMMSYFSSFPFTQAKTISESQLSKHKKISFCYLGKDDNKSRLLPEKRAQIGQIVFHPPALAPQVRGGLVLNEGELNLAKSCKKFYFSRRFPQSWSVRQFFNVATMQQSIKYEKMCPSESKQSCHTMFSRFVIYFLGPKTHVRLAQQFSHVPSSGYHNLDGNILLRCSKRVYNSAMPSVNVILQSALFYAKQIFH